MTHLEELTAGLCPRCAGSGKDKEPGIACRKCSGAGAVVLRVHSPAATQEGADVIRAGSMAEWLLVAFLSELAKRTDLHLAASVALGEYMESCEPAPSSPTLEADGLVDRLYDQAEWGTRNPINTDVLREAAAAITQLRERLASVERERDEAVDWSNIVDRYGTDQFDDLADAWLALDAIQRVTNAATSTFAKWADDDLMARFRQQQLSVFHMAFVEGCLAGAKAAEAVIRTAQQPGGK